MHSKRICRHGIGVVISVLSTNGRGQSEFNREEGVDEESASPMLGRNGASGPVELLRVIIAWYQLDGSGRVAPILCIFSASFPSCVR